MNDILKFGMQWEALRYAVDMLDVAWSYESLEYSGKLLEQKTIEMKAHRRQLLELQNDLLDNKRKLEE